MSNKTLDEWLAWQESLHPVEIELGLDRCRQVKKRMRWPEGFFFLFTVGGTNGKGSCVAFLEAILLAAGYRPGVYTSPHLQRYNERVRVSGVEVSDEVLCQAFERVEEARRGVALTYFEFGTLAAVEVFYSTGCDVVILEVGLGGRLDATNVFDADVAVLTTIALDHAEWLGETREAIGREKAGIFKPGRAAVCGEPAVPRSVVQTARELGVTLYVAQRDFRFFRSSSGWTWQGVIAQHPSLPQPSLRGEFQLQNAAAALMALEAGGGRVSVSGEAIRSGLVTVSLRGRLQVLPGNVERIVDVAHNPEAAHALAEFLRQQRCDGRTFALMAMLKDKDIVGVATELATEVDHWCIAGLQVSRAALVQQLAEALVCAGVNGPVDTSPDVAAAYRHVRSISQPGDRIVVFGSFHTAGQILRLESSQARPDTLADGREA